MDARMMESEKCKGGQKVRCLKCKDVIQSMHRHDFVRCKCGAIFVDGGAEYLRIGWEGEGDAEDYMEFIKEGL